MSNRQTLLQAALRINESANAEDDKFSIDPIIILSIANLILALIKMAYKCRSSDKRAKKILKNPGPVARFLLKREISKRYPKGKRSAIYNAVLKESKNASDKELNEMINHYKKKESGQ